MILVAGATGNVGAELVRALAGIGEPVRALTRRPGTATLPAGATAVGGDLRPVSFMSNTLRWAGQLRAGDVVRAPFGQVPVAAVDPHDIAAVAAEALLSGGHDGCVYPLTGPEALLPAGRVRILGDVLGRELRFAESDDEARTEMTAAGLPAEYVDAFFRLFSDGTLDESPALPTIAEVTGRPPRTFRQWAVEHAAAFR